MIAVIGAGRSGTNMVLEILRGNSLLKASEPPENKTLFNPNKFINYQDNYLTKCDTHYFSIRDLDLFINRCSHLKLILTIRDPKDMILSKLYRGQTKANGGDCDVLADDATPEGCLADLGKMFGLFSWVMTQYSDQYLLIRMEDVIKDIDYQVSKMCIFLGLNLEKEMRDFSSRMRNISKAQRYKGIDKSQICLWDKYKTIYGGFFAENNFPLEGMFSRVSSMRRYFGYW